MKHWNRRIVALLALGTLAAPVAGQSSEDAYYRAYFLEVEEGDFAEALALYERLLQDRGLSAELRTQVEERIDGCREELACEDFAGLMPENPLVYVEINSPGDQLEGLLEELGLLQMAHDAAEHPMGVSPALIQGALGARGAALALTGVNPSSGQPTGVAVLNPGDLDLVRGLLETALPSGAEPVDPIEGYPSYSMDGQGFVTLTSRLVVASTHRREIQRVLRRIHGGEEDSLAGNAHLVGSMGDRDGALVTICVNPAPLVPLAKAAAAGDSQAATWMSVFDPGSLDTLVGRITVAPELGLELALNMTEGHHNLAYDFLRLPPIQESTLAHVPGGAAAFVAMALNDRRSYTAADPDERYVSFLDVGRELFGNVSSLALFAMPPAAADPTVGEVPRAGAVVTVNDPAETQLVWSTLLGVASLASGGGAFEGDPLEVGGVEARKYAFPDGLSVWGAVANEELYLATTRGVLEAALATRAGAPSVLDDETLRPAVARLDGDSTVAAIFHAGRLLELAAQLGGGADERMAEVAPLLERSVGAVVLGHGPDRLSASLALAGLPNVGTLVAAHLEERRHEEHERDRLSSAMGDGRWEEAAALLDERIARHPADLDLLERKLELLARAGRVEEAVAAFQAIRPHVEEDALWLNDFAWTLLTEEPYAGSFAGLALEIAERANELTGMSEWMLVDTLALAAFETGDRQRAVELEEHALELVGDGPRRGEVEAALERFRAAAEDAAPEGSTTYVYSVF